MISGNANEVLQASCGVRKADQLAGDVVVGGGAASKAAAAASSRQWSASTESRIVRVSRVFGGKDRHSKVRTVKGLRDRRVRLSVPTAIQLYDLQDRLGLSQPSKVVDWLITAAQHEIDKLPPLQFPPAPDHLSSVAAVGPPFSSAAATSAAASMLVYGGGDKAGAAHCGGGGGLNLKGFMSLNNSLGLVNTAMAATPTLAHHGPSYYAAHHEPWSANGNVHDVSHGASPAPVVAHHHSPFPSLLSLAPGSQLVFYSSEAGGFAMKEAADQFPVDNLDHSQGQLSLSSARSFLHSGSHV